MMGDNKMLDNFFDVVRRRFNGNNDDDTRETVKCPRCTSLILLERYEELHRICPNCNYHGRLSSPSASRLLSTRTASASSTRI